MKRNTCFKIFALLHLIFIVCICSISSYDSYCGFYKLEKKSLVINNLAKILKPKIVQLYGRISGCDAGYGFFAPNVRSSGMIVTENGREQYAPEFKSLEAMTRFSTFESTISDHFLENDEEVQDRSWDSLAIAYYDLVFKAIAVKLLTEKNIKSRTPVIAYDLYQTPSLASYRKGIKNASLVRLYQLELMFNK